MLRKNLYFSYLLAIFIVVAYLSLLYFIATSYMGFSFTPQRSDVSALDGLTGLGGASGGANKVLATSDGGQHWTQRYSTRYHFDSFSCPTTASCFAAGAEVPLVLSTDDSGKTWATNYSQVSALLTHLSCPQPNTCYALGNNFRGNVLLVSSDLGQHWLTLSLGQSQKDLNALACPTTTTCYLVGSEGRILATTDSGKNWNSLTSGTDHSLLNISCASATSCVAVGRLGTLVATRDGQNWTKAAINIPADFTTVSCPDANTCYAAGGSPTKASLYTTGDSGQTWKELSYSSGGIYALSCPSARHCFAAGPAGLLRVTSDGGQSWQPQTSGLQQDLNNITCPSDTVCYLFSAQPVIDDQSSID